ncbi:MAG TPA: BadF/BadG/BcrA/BcrD ATPase family protein [Candidatus Binatia bacterium]|nr:BadF/BadG/BcrA/BcrD ATPase family protein [Candidatus Binatia bacterium]
MNEEQAILAVAGDNTKTDVAILERDGTLRAAVRGQGASPDLLGLETSLYRLGDLIEKAWLDTGGADGTRRASVGMYFLAGVNSPAAEQRVSQAIAARGWSATNQVANDVFGSLWAANGKGEGVAVFVGAGINCVGQLGSGARARFACLGPLSGDFGDGRSLGIEAIAAAVRGEDGRGAPTILSRIIAQYFGRATASDVALALHDGDIADEHVLEVVPLLINAAAMNDEVADALLERQAEEVAGYIVAAARQLGIAAKPFDAVLSGSLAAGEKWPTVVRMRRHLDATLPGARTVISTALPVLGAALAGLSFLAAGEAAKERIRASLVPHRLHVVGGSAYMNFPGQ